MNRLGDSGVNRLGDISAFVIPAGQLLLTRRGKTRMYTVGIVFKFYTVPLWCGVNRLGDGGVNRLGDTSGFVTPAGELLLPGGVRPECIPSA